MKWPVSSICYISKLQMGRLYCMSSISVISEHQYGLWEGHRRHSVHLHRAPPPLRYSQHPRLVPQQRLYFSVQPYPIFKFYESCTFLVFDYAILYFEHFL